MPLHCTLAALAMVAAAAPPGASPQPRAAAPAPAPAGALAGPSVEVDRATRGIVARDFEGRVVRPETTPEQASLALLDLDAASRAGVDAVLAERARLLEAFVAENAELLQKLATADAAGERVKQIALALEAYQKLEGVRAKGPLREQIRKALAPDAAERFEAILAAYDDALVDDARRSGETKPRWAILAEERLKAFGKEGERAFERSVESGGLALGLLTVDLNLRPEQRGPLREILRRFAELDRQGGQDVQKLSAFIEAMSILDAEQRPKFIARIRGVLPPKPKATAPTPPPSVPPPVPPPAPPAPAAAEEPVDR
ncbi:MAG: hypothetical protein IBJ11_03670 [Phycisphaerales bacterium]|nr:hypothetical protein [Phycisphaerales bacterium]